jgi:hypothetical protein
MPDDARHFIAVQFYYRMVYGDFFHRTVLALGSNSLINIIDSWRSVSIRLLPRKNVRI